MICARGGDGLIRARADAARVARADAARATHVPRAAAVDVEVVAAVAVVLEHRRRVGGGRPAADVDDGHVRQVAHGRDERVAARVEPSEEARVLVLVEDRRREVHVAVAHADGVRVRHAAVVVARLERIADQAVVVPAVVPPRLDHGHVDVTHVLEGLRDVGAKACDDHIRVAVRRVPACEESTHVRVRSVRPTMTRAHHRRALRTYPSVP